MNEFKEIENRREKRIQVKKHELVIHDNNSVWPIRFKLTEELREFLRQL